MRECPHLRVLSCRYCSDLISGDVRGLPGALHGMARPFFVVLSCRKESAYSYFPAVKPLRRKIPREEDRKTRRLEGCSPPAMMQHEGHLPSCPVIYLLVALPVKCPLPIQFLISHRVAAAAAAAVECQARIIQSQSTEYQSHINAMNIAHDVTQYTFPHSIWHTSA